LTPALSSETIAAANPIELSEVEQALVALRQRASSSPVNPSRDAQPVTRACMSNLIVFCDSPEQANALPMQFAAIARRHPARIIALVGDETSGARNVETSVSATLVGAPGQRQISGEQIRISTSASGRERLPSAARSLLIGDLPTALWWNSTQPPPLAGAFFRELEDMAAIIAYDSRGWSDPRRGLIATASWAAESKHRKLVTDLAWMRLRCWRRLMAESLAPQVMPGVLRNIRQVELEHGPHALPMVLLLVGWLADCLGWTPVAGKARSSKKLALRFDSPSGDVSVSIERDDKGPPELRQAILTSRAEEDSAGEVRVEFESIGASRLAVRTQGRIASENVVATPDDPVVVLLAWQLANRTGQPQFARALAIARAMAGEFEA